MDYFTEEDKKWFKVLQENPNKYKVIIDNDSVHIDKISEDEDGYTYTFNSYGYEFIHALLNHMGFNAEYC
jgi:hypothetical protein